MGRWGDGEMGRWGDGENFFCLSFSASPRPRVPVSERPRVSSAPLPYTRLVKKHSGLSTVKPTCEKRRIC
ncbi:MAG TPA: hypothetical protein VK203_23620 [Nostocaceae cyanobacterium]|nr:hypothetical protein [Nostocaceae cyanobacterium]